MARRKTALLMTVGTGIGGQVATEDLAHAILFSIDNSNPDIVIFFGSEKSKKTVESVKEQYLNEFEEEFDYFEFIHLEQIDDFKIYFEAFKRKIQELDGYKIIIDYTSGTKTMTMSAAFASMLYRKNLYFVGGEREDGVVIRGTEKIISQNLYPIYDDLMISKIKELFNTNRFDAGKSLLEDITKAKKDTYANLFDAYYYFDNVDYNKANKYFITKEFIAEWPELKKQFSLNAKALYHLNKEDSAMRPFYILGSLINNARRRAEETKYDDAIARLYRSLELIAQIKLNEYGIDTSDVELDILNKHGVEQEFKPDFSGKIKLSLVQDYELLNNLGDDLGEFYIKNKDEFLATISSRNNSILAHGLNSQTEKQYVKFRDLILKFASVLNPEMDVYIHETEFPEFEIS
ncbi:TIGR02710 family CRISPR-associated CARF protein [Methanobrevibacter smithii]|uniref:TIGR02710 family CRISPR-associated CARF protein n=1 Tax=Methanobrevibacter smithii TaxID=2173 RepID=UPI00242AD01C|nr:TIGR02710 family CRISPR-associated CARF protein [Methanobrevibacter smithii]HJI98388.1 TIGR02710 family CRISPR-associated CARF protein [Methanobrevibacter smithii]